MAETDVSILFVLLLTNISACISNYFTYLNKLVTATYSSILEYNGKVKGNALTVVAHKLDGNRLLVLSVLRVISLAKAVEVAPEELKQDDDSGQEQLYPASIQQE